MMNVNMCVSSCRCSVLVSVVHPVAILSAMFCVICSLLPFVSDARGPILRIPPTYILINFLIVHFLPV